MTVPSLFGDSNDHEGPAPLSPSANESSSPAPGSASTSSLYRKYRPQSFDSDELVGQEHIVRTLRNAVRLERVAHAYLFSGPRGTGKTTTARVLAKAINCLHEDPGQRPCNACPNCLAINAGASPDIIEIDAASNRGIDDIRDLRERVRYAPAQLRSKVYIIDEAHQITGAAANAFLKTLEEPPAHTRFILATTDPEQLLPTIVSRCQRFDFRRVGAEDIVRRLQAVAALEGMSVEVDALRLIARHATGSLRDALGLLEQLALGSEISTEQSPPASITVADVTAALGLSRNERLEGLVAALGQRDAGEALRIVQHAVDDGEDPRQLNRQLLAYLRLLLIERSGGTGDADGRARELASMFSLSELAALARRFGEIDFTIKHSPYPQLPLEVALVEAVATAAPETDPKAHGTERLVEQPVADASTSPPPRPTSLRDRVRSTASIREVPAPETTRPDQAEPATITPLRSLPVPEAAVMTEPVDVGPYGIEQIAELWPSVRADVKALNRRIEALLSEVDPVAISGNQITLAVPYPFHRDKLNSDDVRETVGGVLSRLLGKNVSLVCILRSEMAATAVQSTPIQAEDPSASQPNDEASDDEEERARVRIRAAKNIFDAEEIPETESESQPIPARDA
ncbi:MAG: polymerase subunit gamma and tau [Thermomicrobiales bacterium]|nr:polymerase subunit gamma and tau [Thermomicrobiales bacterium]